MAPLPQRRAPAPAPRAVFVSYTAEDLEAHARVVVDACRRAGWLAVDHRDWAPTP